MRIKSLTLGNIRSYVNQRIEFPEGSLLLSGNIGSGKTSLLLAIDFALFGLRKGALSSNALLRKGQDYGFVELNFEISGKDVIIRRNLKKGSSGISQEAGFFILDGYKEELSPVELKQKVLELFNYPRETLTKSKGLIYNYTVYTPQEEMKSILLADVEERLNILRRVFGIDKYKRVVENSKVLISKLKDRKKEFNLLSSDLEEFKEERKIKEEKISEVESKITLMKTELNEIKNKVESKRKNVELLEEKGKRRKELESDFQILTHKLEGFIDQKTRNNTRIDILNKEINDLDRGLKEFNIVDLEIVNKRISDVNEDLIRVENENKELSKKLGEFEFVIKNSEKVKNDVKDLDICPVCHQNVGLDHKHRISNNEESRIKDTKVLFEQYTEKEKENKKLTLEFRVKLDTLLKSKNEVEIFRLKKNNLNDRTENLQNLLDEQNRIKKDIGEINSQKLGIDKLLVDLPDVSEEYNKVKLEMEEILVLDRKLHSELYASEREINIVKGRIEELSLDILKKEKFKEKIVKYSEMITYLEKDFTSLIQIMEKQIMRKIHFDFDKLFKDWFRILVENEDLDINLNYDFSPLISQNGYDIEYSHLSGGERTAAALAYRLALNQVINTLMSEINTRDILILDEPTDGFSSEQVDKLRIILEELNVEQVIIVSHDPKIESFVDNVIRFEKKEGSTYLSQG